jgi:CPA2 family monovalent cation:H+ antiporter-2
MDAASANLFEDILLVIGLSILVVILFQRLHLPAIAGFILTGTLIGPHLLGWIEDAEAIKFLAEMGVVLLLFSLGIEFSATQMWQLRHYVFTVGLLQIILTILLCSIGASLLGYSLIQSIALGMIISMSSTAIVIKLLKQRNELDSVHGRLALGTSLFQDIMAPALMATMPFLPQIATPNFDLLKKPLVTLIALLLAFILAKKALPLILRWITTSQSREVPVLGSIFLALLMGYITEKLGLSPALGAFMAGMIISETPYSHQITANIGPFRDSFIAIFFISVGLLVDLPYIIENFSRVIGWTLLLMALKCGIIIFIGTVIKRPLRITLISGVLLANIGEFSFVLIAQANNILPYELINALIAGTSISILLTPILLSLTYFFVESISKKSDLLSYIKKSHVPKDELKEHIIIVGFGLNGRNLANLLRELNKPFIVVEINGALVREAEKQGIPVVYGDASFPEILEAAGIKTASTLVLAMSDPISTRHAVRSARNLNPSIYIIARTRYVSEIEKLYEAGATDVIPEEFETFIEIASRIMRMLKISDDDRLKIMNQYRNQHYKIFQETEEGVFTN